MDDFFATSGDSDDGDGGSGDDDDVGDDRHLLSRPTRMPAPSPRKPPLASTPEVGSSDPSLPGGPRRKPEVHGNCTTVGALQEVGGRDSDDEDVGSAEEKTGADAAQGAGRTSDSPEHEASLRDYMVSRVFVVRLAVDSCSAHGSTAVHCTGAVSSLKASEIR